MGLYSLWKRAALVAVLLLTLYMISTSDFTVFTALQRHEPSLRIFRSLLQINLILWGTALSLYVWSLTVGVSVIGDLFFQPLAPLLGNDNDRSTTGPPVAGAENYRPVVSVARRHDNKDHDHASDENDDDDSENADEQVRTAFSDDAGDAWDDAHDAHYESDGEVEKKQPRQFSTTTSASVVGVPSAVVVASAALDMLLLILVTLFFFTITSSAAASASAASNTHDNNNDSNNDIWNWFARIAAPIFPLLLFLYLTFVALFPWNKRGPFWMVVSLTWTAPWHDVTFRDGFIGDILTSAVRPLQDIAFTISYLLFGLRGWWSQNHDHDQDQVSSFDNSSVPAMERSWLLHTVILPMCMVSPLWWRFLQNLRQCHDARQRWPYLGNATKYFLAAQVAMFGVFHPGSKQTAAWLTSFVVATLYQVWWDVFMDWGLIVRTQKDGMWKWQLRSERLYSKRWVYWAIAWVNLVLRFCWTLTFLPPRYLNAAGALTENFSDDLNTQVVLGSTIASAEIIRRMLWGLLRFEWEAIKETRDDFPFLHSGETTTLGGENERGIEMTPMKMGDDGSTLSSLIPPVALSNDMSSMNDIQVLGELGLYSCAFCVFGMVVAAHRGTA
jgi:hypothetical protein